VPDLRREGVDMKAPFVRIMNGDVLDHLRELPDESVHMCCTSPPYWGLRDYSRCGCAKRDYAGGENGMPLKEGGQKFEESIPDPSCPICHGTGKVAGTERQLGLEPTPEAYVANLVKVFQEVKRVLRGDGTVWLNLGDSYFGDSPVRSSGKEQFDPAYQTVLKRSAGGTRRSAKSVDGLKSKDLIGFPWRCAFALQQDGWYLRSDIIWSKPNPMPESVTDRPTKAHEYIFLLSKSPRYFYDQEAVREKYNDKTIERLAYPVNQMGGPHGEFGAKISQGGNRKMVDVGNGRNSRTVWDIATQPYPEAHFATFPEELPRRCIKAGTSEKGCCPKCGASWERIIESDRTYNPPPIEALSPGGKQDSFTLHRDGGGVYSSKRAIGWQPICSCGLTETSPCVVLDPFAGSGTTGAVARSMGRSSILIELNPEYVKLIKERCATEHIALDTFEEVPE
jgi:DNA modification methylase